MRQQKGRSFGRRFASVALAVAATALLASCSAGQLARTSTELPAVNGDLGGTGTLLVNNAALAYPEGGEDYWADGSDVPLHMSIANRGDRDDALRSVTSSVTDDVAIEGDTAIDAHKALTVGGGTPEVSGEPAAEVGSGEFGVASVTLRGIEQDLFPGQVVYVTLTFEKSGTVKLRVPIEAPDEPRADESHAESQEAHGGTGESHGGSGSGH